MIDVMSRVVSGLIDGLLQYGRPVMPAGREGEVRILLRQVLASREYAELYIGEVKKHFTAHPGSRQLLRSLVDSELPLDAIIRDGLGALKDASLVAWLALDYDLLAVLFDQLTDELGNTHVAAEWYDASLAEGQRLTGGALPETLLRAISHSEQE